MYGGGVLCGFLHAGIPACANRGQEAMAMDESAKKVAITFDDGPNPDYTEMLLAGLKERGVNATFFCWEKKWSSIRRS